MVAMKAGHSLSSEAYLSGTIWNALSPAKFRPCAIQEIESYGAGLRPSAITISLSSSGRELPHANLAAALPAYQHALTLRIGPWRLVCRWTLALALDAVEPVAGIA